jgi:hypothetical protein
VKLKRQTRTVIKKNEGEVYTFRNGVAKVPGCNYRGKPMMITLKEYKELT